MSSGEKMQVIRPKSSKGRSRPMMANFQRVETSVQPPTLSPQPPTKSKDKINQCQPQAVLSRRSQPYTEVLDEIFDRPLDEPASLNRYRVLPSIEKKTTGNESGGVERKALQLDHGGNRHRICKHNCVLGNPTKNQDNAGMRNVLNSPNRSVVMSKGTTTGILPQEEPDLVLAIRNPCGQRFKCHFHPSDKLQVVLSHAEAEFGEKYENCIIETMDVPRRTFTTLTMTLAQCGILNKSVLCISQDDSNMDST